VEMIWFESAVVARADGDEIIVFAFMDGEDHHRCVAMLHCSVETAGSLRAAITSALGDSE
jgi:hypothetical protein